MKTIDKNRQKVLDYLDKTSKHTFVRKDREDEGYFKVIKDGDKFKVLRRGKVFPLDIDYYINYYGRNAKNVIKHRLFLNENMYSIKNTKYVKANLAEILEGSLVK